MSTLFVGQNKITLQSVDSTNNYAAKLIKMSFVPDGTVIMAQNQTEGKGQRENKWKSESGQNLLCSYILQPKSLSASWSFSISMLAALSVYDTLRNVSDNSDVAIKWPNDLMLNNKKVGGILIENSIVKGEIKYCIVGIGINSNQTEFEFPHASSIVNETNLLIDTDNLLDSLSTHLEKRYLQLINNDLTSITQTYNTRLWKLGKNIKSHYQNRSISGYIKKVTEDGKLMFETDEGELILADFSELKIVYE